MDTSLMNSLRSGDGGVIYSQVSSWSRRLSDSENSPQSDETAEDYKATLSSWRRHVASLPMLDSEDFVSSDVFQETPSPCKNDKFFAPSNYNNYNSEDYSTETKIIPNHGESHNSKIDPGDNRLMDNDNTSPQFNIDGDVVCEMEDANKSHYMPIGNVVYQFEGDPSRKFIAYQGSDEHLNQFTDAIQVITVNPESLDMCDSSSDNYDSDSCCEDETDNHNEQFNSETKDYNMEISKIHNYEETNANVNLNSFATCENQIANEELRNSRRSVLKSFSLPTSPCHELNPCDFQTSLTLEDLKSADIERMFVNPMQVFNKNFDDVFDEATPNPTDVAFDPIIPLGVKSCKNTQSNSFREFSVTRDQNNEVKLDDSATNEYFDKIIDKNGLIEKVMNSSDLLFDSDAENAALIEDLNNFDLPNFIMSESPSQPGLLKDGLDCSPITPIQTPLCKNKSNDFCSPKVALSTPLQKTIKTASAKSPLPSQLNDTPIKSNLIKAEETSSHGYNHFSNDISQKGISLGDADDFVDVETVSDGETIPVLSANNLDSLLEQFEATENMQKQVPTSNNNSNWKTVVLESNDRNKLVSIPAHNLLKNDVSSESIHMDHDYCSPVKESLLSHGRRAMLIENIDSDENKSNNAKANIINFLPCNGKISHGIGKNIAKCMEYRTDEFKDSSDPIISNNVQNTQSVLQNDCSINEHSYSKIDFKKYRNIVVPLNNQIHKNGECNGVVSIGSKTVKNSVTVVLTGNKNIISNKSHANGLLNLNKNTSKIITLTKPLVRQNQSLLKPAVKEEIKKVSLLKLANASKVENVKPLVDVKTEKPSVAPPKEVRDTTVVLNETKEIFKAIEKIVPNKRKLNLEEYKKRRGTDVRSCEVSRASSPMGILAADIKTFSSPNSPINPEEIVVLQTETINVENKHETQKNMLDKDLKSNHVVIKSEVKLFDPIADASKKALHLKKIASQKCPEDRIVKSKIPKLDDLEILPITTENGVVLPMIKKTNSDTVDRVVVPPIKRKNSEYEEIVMVSIGVNTDSNITNYNDSVQNNPAKTASIQFKIVKKNNSLIRPNVFGVADDENISEDVTDKISNEDSGNNKVDGSIRTLAETLQKVEKIKDFKITSNSLISSIQKVVNKKRKSGNSPKHDKVVSDSHADSQHSDKNVVAKENLNCSGLTVSDDVKDKQDCKQESDVLEEHGEDKVIMHLKKNRIKPQTIQAMCQTDCSLISKYNLKNGPDNKESTVNQTGGGVNGSTEKLNTNCALENCNGKGKVDRIYRNKRNRSSSVESNYRSYNDQTRPRRFSNQLKRRRRSTDRLRRSDSPIRSRYSCRSRSHSRWSGNYNRNRIRNNQNYRRSRNSRFNRRSRNLSRHRRHYSHDRWRSDRSYSPVRSEKYRSRSRDKYGDNRSIKSLYSSRSHRSSRSSYERRISRLSQSLSPLRNSGCANVTTNGADHIRDSATNVAKVRTQSESSTSSSSSGSSSSSSSTSSSSSSSDSDSSVFYSDHRDDRLHHDMRHRNFVKSQHSPKSLSPRKLHPMEERRVVFVGRLEKNITKEQMRTMFAKFGTVREVTLHRKDDGSRYGFVTFSKPQQSYHVVECANKDPVLQKYDVSFGGRRVFCRNVYADLDDIETMEEPEFYGDVLVPQPVVVRKETSDFDSLLQQMKQAVEAKQRAKQRDSH